MRCFCETSALALEIARSPHHTGVDGEEASTVEKAAELASRPLAIYWELTNHQLSREAPTWTLKLFDFAPNSLLWRLW